MYCVIVNKSKSTAANIYRERIIQIMNVYIKKKHLEIRGKKTQMWSKLKKHKKYATF